MITQHAGINTLLAILGFIVFFYIVYQILVFMEISVNFLFEYLMFFASLGILYLFIPKNNMVWK
jgi:hypothetical protein